MLLLGSRQFDLSAIFGKSSQQAPDAISRAAQFPSLLREGLPGKLPPIAPNMGTERR